MVYFWVCLMIVAVCAEAMTAGLVAIWFMPSALLAMLLSFIPGFPVWAQITVFVITSLLLLLYARPLCSRMFRRTATNVDAIIGEKAVVVEKIQNIAGCGQVKVPMNGQFWSARSISDGEDYEVGEVLTVVAIEGVKLICKKQ